MADRKLLILTFHFPPSAASGSFRLLGFARHLPKFGWRCLVVAPPPLPWEPEDPKLAGQVPPETQVWRVPYFTGRLGIPVRLWAPYTPWLLRAWPTLVRAVREHRPDAILTSGPPHQVHTFGGLLRRRFGIPWVADYRDPWVACGPLEADRSLGARWQARQERAAMRRADAIVANAPNACEALRAAYLAAADRMVAITNGFDPERFAAASPVAAATGSDDPLTILHPGQIYAGRDPGPLLDALRRVVSDRQGASRPIRVEFIGNLKADRAGSELDAAVRDRGLEPIVSIKGQVPYAQSLEAMVRADILLLLDGPGRKIGVPAKLYEFIGAGRPILALAEPDGDTAWVLRESGVTHRIASTADPADIHRALQELIREALAEDGARIVGDEESPFTRRNLAGRLAALLDRQTGRASGAADADAMESTSWPITMRGDPVRR